MAKLLATDEGIALIEAKAGAELMDAPSENDCRGLLGVIRLCRDSRARLFKLRELKAKEALAEQIALEREARAAMESGVTRASADVAFPAVSGGEPH
jgi:hypothetical protein